MKGCSTCETGKESFEVFYSRSYRKRMIRYDYRDVDGKLFSCIAPDLLAARLKLDKWLERKQG